MSNNASGVDEKAANQNEDHAVQALGAYNGDMADFMGNVNSELSAGNPYESKEYKTNQNLETSGAMNSENDAERERLGETVARTGTNSAAIANEEGESARQGQRDLTNYNATRDTANEDKWLQEEQGLNRDLLEGAQSEAGVYGSSTGAQSSDLGSMTQADDAEQQMWASLAGAAASGAGVGAGIAMHG